MSNFLTIYIERVRIFKFLVGILQGVKRTSFNTYDFKIAASPNSDHVMFGGGDCFAVIWDLQVINFVFVVAGFKFCNFRHVGLCKA